jgi:hypothetical protein
MNQGRTEIALQRIRKARSLLAKLVMQRVNRVTSAASDFGSDPSGGISRMGKGIVQIRGNLASIVGGAAVFAIVAEACSSTAASGSARNKVEANFDLSQCREQGPNIMLTPYSIEKKSVLCRKHRPEAFR